MASIGQLKLPDNNNYNLSVPFIVGTGSTAGTWLGTLAGVTEYYDGLLILYKPSVAGASTTTLNLNGIGAKTCYINNTTKLTTHFPVNQPILLTYSESQNSGCWMCIDNYWTNTIPSAICTTAAATAAKVASCDYYTATANSYIHIVMRYANTSATALTLNIASEGAKPIYINGTASSASNYTLPAGSYIIFYDGTNYYFRTDGKLTADITGDAGTVNGLTVQTAVPANAKFTDTTYESKTAVSEGTDVSLCTTGEKYSWNNKMDKTNPSGSGSFSLNRNTGSNIGECSVAIGYGSEARGDFSTAIGTGTIAKNAGQIVIGRFNIEDPGSSNPNAVGTYAEIVGNGMGSDSSFRSNARTLDWDGNEVLAGGLKLNGTEDVITTSESAASGGTDLSLVTTGEKYTWNSKVNLNGAIIRTTFVPGTATYSSDDMRGQTRFLYQIHGVPYTGTTVSFDSSNNENYTLQLNAKYSASVSDARFSFRTRNGDKNEWSNWLQCCPVYRYTPRLEANTNRTLYVPLEMRNGTAGDCFFLVASNNYGNSGLYFLSPCLMGSDYMLITTIKASSYLTVAAVSDDWGFKVTAGSAAYWLTIIRLS